MFMFMPQDSIMLVLSYLPLSAAMVRARIDQGCPVCHRAQQGEGSGVPATLSRLQSPVITQ